MKSKDNNFENTLAIKYLGRALIAIIICIGIYALASLGYNTYITASKEKIEVHAENSNSIKRVD